MEKKKLEYVRRLDLRALMSTSLDDTDEEVLNVPLSKEHRGEYRFVSGALKSYNSSYLGGTLVPSAGSHTQGYLVTVIVERKTYRLRCPIPLEELCHHERPRLNLGGLESKREEYEIQRAITRALTPSERLTETNMPCGQNIREYGYLDSEQSVSWRGRTRHSCDHRTNTLVLPPCVISFRRMSSLP